MHRLKHFLDRNDGGCWGDDPTGIDDTVVLRSTEQSANGDWRITDPAVRHVSATERKSKTIDLDDIIITKSSGSADHIGKASIADQSVAELEAVYSNFMQRIRVNRHASPRYAWHLLNSSFARYHYNVYATSTSGLGNLNGTIVGNLPFPLPDLATQRQIADFLDRETARIDLLIEKKQRLVELLGERQEVLVEEQLEAVDGSHVHRLKFAILRIEQGWSPQCEDAPVEGEKWGVLKLGAITTGVYLENHHKALPETIDPIPSLKVNVGDVLVARASGSPRLVGKAAFVETTNLNLLLSDKHFRLVPNREKVLPEYLATAVNSGKSRSQIEDRLSSAEGMARNIGQNVIYGLRCPFPPLAAQEEILTTLRLSRTNTDAIVTKTNASIDRLNEYRSALITAAVTGQIDVSTYAKSGIPDRRLDAIQEEMGA